MRNIMFAGTAAVAAMVVAWSMAPLTKPKVDATEALGTILPYEIMVKQGRLLPTQYWAHPF
jgi:hypothetical protein